MSDAALETRPDIYSDANRQRMWKEWAFQVVALAAILLAILVLMTLLINVMIDGLARLSPQFLTSAASRRAAQAGILYPLVGSLYLMGLTALFAAPLGIGAAIYLEEYAPVNRLTRLIELNIANLAGVPSIVYGLLSLQIFVRAMHLERSLVAGALTLALLILPVIILASREALRAVPQSIRHGARALGATQWQTIYRYVMPLAMPGILTGVILAFSRAVGETAPLIAIGVPVLVTSLPSSWDSSFTALPLQIYDWIGRPQPAFHQNAAAAILVLMGMLILLNSAAIFLRMRLQKRQAW